MKNVLIALPNDTLGGAEQFLKNIARYFTENNNIYVLFLKESVSGGWNDLQSDPHVNLIFTKEDSETKGIFTFFINILEMRKMKFDFIFTSHVHLTGIIGLLIKLKIIKKCNFIGRESTTIFNRFKGLKLLMFKFQYFLGYSALDLLICQTNLMKHQLLESLPNLAAKINVQVIANPVNFSNVNANEEVFYENYIVSAGRLIHEKGFDILIDAYFKLQKVYPELKLVILGEGPKREELEKKIIELDLDQKVFLPGFVNNVYPYFKKAKLCVVSSRVEGFPNVLLQMMSQNTKVVSTKCAGGIDEIEGVIVAETNNVNSLIDATIKSLNANSEKNRQLFDNNLEERNIDNFINKVELYLKSATY